MGDMSTMVQQLSAETTPEIIYPDSDGQPMADNTKQYQWIVKIKENLEILFASRDDVFIAGDLLWYPVEGNPKIRQAPDVLVVFGRLKGDRGSYQQWKENNIPPQVVFEILSPGNRTPAMINKSLFYQRYGVDVRSIRYPGLISYKSAPGGGTTDYAIEIFHEALAEKKYECFLKQDTYLPMMYMPDAIKATIELMEAPQEKIKIRTSYNISGMSFSPKEIADEIKKYIPDFDVTYQPDYRQAIADSWPQSIDDSVARNDWGWKEDYNLERMTKDMLENITPIKI